MKNVSLGRLFNYLWLLVNAKVDRLISKLSRLIILLESIRASIGPDEGRWLGMLDGMRRVWVHIYRNEAARSLSLQGGKSPVLINWHG